MTRIYTTVTTLPGKVNPNGILKTEIVSLNTEGRQLRLPILGWPE